MVKKETIHFGLQFFKNLSKQMKTNVLFDKFLYNNINNVFEVWNRFSIYSVSGFNFLFVNINFLKKELCLLIIKWLENVKCHQ